MFAARREKWQLLFLKHIAAAPHSELSVPGEAFRISTIKRTRLGIQKMTQEGNAKRELFCQIHICPQLLSCGLLCTCVLILLCTIQENTLSCLRQKTKLWCRHDASAWWEFACALQSVISNNGTCHGRNGVLVRESRPPSFSSVCASQPGNTHTAKRPVSLSQNGLLSRDGSAAMRYIPDPTEHLEEAFKPSPGKSPLILKSPSDLTPTQPSSPRAAVFHGETRRRRLCHIFHSK